MTMNKNLSSRHVPILFPLMGVLMTLMLLMEMKEIDSSPITNPFPANGDLSAIMPDYLDTHHTEESPKKDYHKMSPNTAIQANAIKLKSAQTGTNDDLCVDSESVEFKLRWSNSLGSAVYASPVIFPSADSDNKRIFVSNYYTTVELINGDGYKPWGWPLSFEGSSFHASPVLHDVDGDGELDVGVSDTNGNLFWIATGRNVGEQYLEDYHIQIPKLKVKRNWAKGINPQFSDTQVLDSLSTFDRNHRGVGDGKGSLDPDVHQSTAPKLKVDALKAVTGDIQQSEEPIDGPRRRLLEVNEGQEKGGEGEGEGETVPEKETKDGGGEGEGRGKVEEEEEKDGEREEEGQGQGEGEGENVSPFPDDDAFEYGGKNFYGYGHRDLDGEQRYSSFGSSVGDDGFGYYDALRYGGGMYNDSDFVYIDAHVLTTPAMADINHDGHMEIIFAVSYYFDDVDYAHKRNTLNFDPDDFVAGGIACWDMALQTWSWLVHLDLTTNKNKFQAMIYSSPTIADLDGDGRTEVIVGTGLGLLYVLDGDSGFVRRYFPLQFHSINAQISVGDVMGGPHLEMVVVDMGGTIAVVNVRGEILWDAQLSGSLPFAPTIGDVDGDGQIDIVVVAVAEDSSSSHVWALAGDTGLPLAGYPISLPRNQMISAPVILVDLHRGSAGSKYEGTDEGTQAKANATRQDSNKGVFDILGGQDAFMDGELLATNLRTNKNEGTGSNHSAPLGLHLLVTAFEGHIYIIDGSALVEWPVKTTETDSAVSGVKSKNNKKHGKVKKQTEEHVKCAQRIDVGEHLYSVPLLDDLTGDGYLDLVIGTMNGQLLSYESSIPFHSVNAWDTFPKNRLNGFSQGDAGISIPQSEREKLKQLQTKINHNLTIDVDIWDANFEKNRAVYEAEGTAVGQVPQYIVTVTEGAGLQNPLLRQSFARPGRYTLSILVQPPMNSLLLVRMQNGHFQHYEDSVHVSISSKFYIWIKYMAAAPVAIFCFPLLLRYGKFL